MACFKDFLLLKNENPKTNKAEFMCVNKCPLFFDEVKFDEIPKKEMDNMLGDTGNEDPDDEIMKENKEKETAKEEGKDFRAPVDGEKGTGQPSDEDMLAVDFKGICQPCKNCTGGCADGWAYRKGECVESCNMDNEEAKTIEGESFTVCECKKGFFRDR